MNNRKFDEAPDTERRKITNMLSYPQIYEYETVIHGQKVKVKVYKPKLKSDIDEEYLV
jgi:hypothetical protein